MALRLILAFCAFSLAIVPEILTAADPVAVPPPQQFWMGVCWGGVACISQATLGANIQNALFAAGGFICSAVFIVGAGFFTLGGVNETFLQDGKNMMRYSLVGLALIIGAFAIYRTVVFILY